MVRVVAESLRIEPDTPFSLAAAAAFGFGPNTGRPKPEDGVMRLAFALDGFAGHAGVVVRQDPEGALTVEVQGSDDLAGVERQLRRVLSLDHPGAPWLEVGERDLVIGRLQAEHPGLRPVLFHSPYEGAAWSVISHRRHHRQAASVRTRLAEELGPSFTLAGELTVAFPLPQALAGLDSFAGLEAPRMARLRAVAEAALEGRLDPEHLQAMGPEAALAEVQRLPGIGPFYAGLVVIRATGFADVLPLSEPRVLAYVTRLYGLDEPPGGASFTALAEPWRPYRTWAVVLLRVAGDRAGWEVPRR